MLGTAAVDESLRVDQNKNAGMKDVSMVDNLGGLA